MPKQFELKANDKNLTSTCLGYIRQMLEGKKGRKYYDSFDTTFARFQERVMIPPELWVKTSDGWPKWQQAIRNVAKVHPDKKTPDALTQGELMVFVGGGFALPNHVPDGYEVVQFPDIAGLKVKREAPKRPKSHKIVVNTASAVMRVLDLVPEDRRIEVLQYVANEFDCEVR